MSSCKELRSSKGSCSSSSDNERNEHEFQSKDEKYLGSGSDNLYLVVVET